MQEYAQKRKLLLSYIGTGIMFASFLIALGVFTLLNLSEVREQRNRMWQTAYEELKCSEICPTNMYSDRGDRCCTAADICKNKSECKVDKYITFDD